jgi:hypothetical protein
VTELLAVPQPGERYRHRLFEHLPHAEYCDVRVIAVTRDVERLWVSFVHVEHRNGRRDGAMVSVKEFRDTYPERVQ